MARQDILIADSELLTRDLLKKMLSSTGFNVHAVSEFAEAEQTLTQKKFPLAMISSKPGDKEVRKMVGRLREQWADCIVFLLSSPPGSYEADSLLRLGIFDVIVKPFRLEEVKLKVCHANEILSLKQRLRKAENQLRKLPGQPIKVVDPEKVVEIPDLESLEKIELNEPELNSESIPRGLLRGKRANKNGTLPCNEDSLRLDAENLQSPEIIAGDSKNTEKSQTSGSEVEKAYKRQAGVMQAGQDAIEQIKRLDELRKGGIVTAAEFESKKKELLERI